LSATRIARPPTASSNLDHDWFADRYIAVDQGPITVMIENHRTRLIWNLFMSCPELPPMMEAIGRRREL
jgi:hypothetical protein